MNKNKKLEKEIIDLKNENSKYKNIINEQKNTIDNLNLFDRKKIKIILMTKF